MDDGDKTVFISYRRDTSSFIARAVFMDLRQHDYDVFMDVESIDSGEFDRAILNQIAARAHFVLILTPGTIERCLEPGDWLRREIEEALRLQRNIVPLLINGFTFGVEAEKYLTGALAKLPHYSGLEVPHNFFNEAMERLRKRYLKQPVYGQITPTPAADQSAIRRRIERAGSQPAPSPAQLNAEEYFNRAGVKWDQGDWRGVIEDCDHAVALNPQYADAYTRRSGAKNNLGDGPGALADAEQSLRLQPNSPSAYRNRGLAHLNTGKVGEAIADFTESLRLRPGYAATYCNRGDAYLRRGDLDQAISDYTEAIGSDPDYGEAYNNRGNAYYMKREFDQAAADFEAAIRLNPSYANSYAGLGDCHYLKQHYRRALHFYERCLELPPSGENRDLIARRVQELRERLK